MKPMTLREAADVGYEPTGAFRRWADEADAAQKRIGELESRVRTLYTAVHFVASGLRVKHAHYDDAHLDPRPKRPIPADEADWRRMLEHAEKDDTDAVAGRAAAVLDAALAQARAEGRREGIEEAERACETGCDHAAAGCAHDEQRMADKRAIRALLPDSAPKAPSRTTPGAPAARRSRGRAVAARRRTSAGCTRRRGTTMPSKPKAYTERQAIDALHALAARWPQTIGLFSWSGSLHVVRWPPRESGMEVYVSTVETIHGIPNDGGDPHANPQQGNDDGALLPDSAPKGESDGE